MEVTDDDQWMGVPECPIEDPRIQVSVDGEHTSDDPNSWAEIVENSSMSHMAEAARPYPAHLSFEVNSFDRFLPMQGLVLQDVDRPLTFVQVFDAPGHRCDFSPI